MAECWRAATSRRAGGSENRYSNIGGLSTGWHETGYMNLTVYLSEHAPKRLSHKSRTYYVQAVTRPHQGRMRGLCISARALPGLTTATGHTGGSGRGASDDQGFPIGCPVVQPGLRV